MYAKVFTGSLWGLDSRLVSVEVDFHTQLPSFQTVGLPDGMIRESKERVKSALKNSGFELPRKKIVVNLAPADFKKDGTGFDFPIALSLLHRMEFISEEIFKDAFFVGELSLSGEVKPVPGVLAHLMMARENGLKKAFVSLGNLPEASLVKDMEVFGVESLAQFFSFHKGLCELKKQNEPAVLMHATSSALDFSTIQGHRAAKRALEIAVAGGHGVFMVGPPGSGKTLLAKAIPSLFPPLPYGQALEVCKIRSILKGIFDLSFVPPFISPHHSTSHVALIGGGSLPKPGLVTQAHHGVLFLDEMAEFEKRSLEALRQVIEEKSIHISRAQAHQVFPGDFLLVAATNPCPCGFATHPEKECMCSINSLARYQAKFSGPLMDRIDIHLNVLPVKDFLEKKEEESSEKVRQRIQSARELQARRFAHVKFTQLNSHISPMHIFDFCKPDSDGKKILETAIEKMQLSHRSFHHILKIARTIADLEGEEKILKGHILEALQYRSVRLQYYQ